MNKIQMTEEQAKDFIKNCYTKSHVYNENKMLATAKEKGYINKTNLEIEASKFYDMVEHYCSGINYDTCINYIEELEKEIMRLKNEI
jgi:hypothetical protein